MHWQQTEPIHACILFFIHHTCSEWHCQQPIGYQSLTQLLTAAPLAISVCRWMEKHLWQHVQLTTNISSISNAGHHSICTR